MSSDEHRSGNSPLLTSKPGSHLATPQGAPRPDRVHLETRGLVLDKIPRVRWPNTFWRRVPTGPSHESGPAMAKPTEPAEPHCNTKDWRPVFEEKMQRKLYNLGASKSFGRYSSIVQMEEAYHDGVMNPQDTNNVAHIEKCDYTKAVSPGSDFDARFIEEARKQRIKALQHSMGRSKELDSVAQDYTKAGTRSLEEFEERCRNELILLCDYVAPRRATPLHIIETMESVEQLAQPADPSPLMRTTEEMRPNSPRPGSPHAVAPIAADSVLDSVLAVLRECSPHLDGVDDWGAGDSNASTVESASNAAIWRCQTRYNEPAKEEEQRRNRGTGSSDSADTLSELVQWLQASCPDPENSGRRDSALAGLEETERGAACEKGTVKFPAADRMGAPSSLLDSVPVPDGRRHRPTKKHTSESKASGRQRENEKPVSQSMVLEPARRTRRLTAEEKGKWVAECECPACQPQQQNKRVRFDESAMNKAEEGPGLSHDGFVKTMKQNRRRVEARARGEGVSSWASSGPTGLVGLDMFRNPRPAPRVPVRGQHSVNVMQAGRAPKRRVNKHDISEPLDGYGVFARVHEFPNPNPGRRSRVTPLGGADPMAVQMDGMGRPPVWRTLSRRLRRSMK